MDAASLDRLDGIGEFNDLARGDVGVGAGG
jgi:hypothetical protein